MTKDIHHCEKCRILDNTIPDSIIGQGERITIKILNELFPNELIERQVPLVKLLNADFVEDMGERAKKETVDIVVYLLDQPLVVRVQDDRHKTNRYAEIDGRQKWELEECDNYVVDIWKSDCPAVFKGENYEKALKEIKVVLKDYLD